MNAAENQAIVRAPVTRDVVYDEDASGRYFILFSQTALGIMRYLINFILNSFIITFSTISP